MASTDVLVLADDALVQCVRDLPRALQLAMNADAETDYLVSRRGWRSPSLLVDSAAASLIVSFRRPQTIIEAVLSYSQSMTTDPHRTLSEAYPIFRRLLRAGVLVAVHSEAAHNLIPSLSPGEFFADVEVRHNVQIFSDTEVYQAKAKDGAIIALKVTRADASATTDELLRREADILEHLGGSVSPAVRDAGKIGHRRYLTMDWCSGVDAAAAADALRTSGSSDYAQQLYKLCRAILSAYSQLHEQGFLHADVHPRNIIVDHDCKVTILDFGLARRLADGPSATPARQGMSFYFEPEYAHAWLAGTSAPPPTAGGEQYSLAALLYRLLTGVHYVDFQLDSALFRQINEDPPIAFAARGRAEWPTGEVVLARALSKNPGERYETVADFSKHFDQAWTCSPPLVRSRITSKSESMLNGVIARLGTDPARVLLSSPTASLHDGAAGIAYLFYRLACLRDDAALLATADLWTERALRESVTPAGFYSTELARTTGDPSSISLYHKVVGVHLVRAIVSSAQGDWMTADAAVKAFCAAATVASQDLDATLGQASALLGCVHLVGLLPASTIADPVLESGRSLTQSIWAQLNDDVGIATSDSVPWLGIAHGWAGILYASLRWLQVISQLPDQTVVNRLDELSRFAEPIGRGAQWPRRSQAHPSDLPPTTGWCHGSAGYVDLWNLADAFFPGRYSALAEQAAWHALETPARTGSGLCCGSGGRAYAMLSMYRCTGDPVWRTRANSLVEQAADSRSRRLRANSLYAGDVGIALLAAEAHRPEIASMPLF